MTLTQDQIAAQMVAQLRILDPSLSAEVGTPERKIIDTVGQAIAESQVDLSVLSASQDLAAKYGTDLDTYVGLFGFGRQTGAFSVGFVTFGRAAASAYPIVIPRGTQVQGNLTINGTILGVVFQTNVAVTLVIGATEVIAPIQALLTGANGNVAAGTITQFANLGAPPLGITSVINAIPTTGGSDSESDAELKVRFRNTVFRNLAGTEDQYLALAVATQYSTKANVVGPISRYREYIQVPPSDDSGAGGLATHWTTALSDNPYAQYIYLEVPNFVSNGVSNGVIGAGTIFFRQDTDFSLNAPPLVAGDTYREYADSESPNPATLPFRPNVTFFNVYTGIDPTVTMPRPGDVLLAEYSYMSAESRNDITRQLQNCVDVYVDGQNATTADTVLPPVPSGLNQFTNVTTDKFYRLNFRRLGQPDVTPVAAHLFSGLFWQPLIALPGIIVVGDNTYTLGVHYWAVQDRTLLGGTVRARDGIEWDPSLSGATTGDPTVTLWTTGQDWVLGEFAFYNGFYTALADVTADTVSPDLDPTNWAAGASPFTGDVITATPVTNFTVAGYTYDRNIIDLQAALDGAKQVTTDVLAHNANQRYLKLDLTVVYAPGASPAVTNASIGAALQAYFSSQYFGTTVQLTDLLLSVRSASGVQNVRWSNDISLEAGLNRVTECDAFGTPRTSAITATATLASQDLTGVSVSAGIPTIGNIVSGTGIPVGTFITDIIGSTYKLSHPYTGVTGAVNLVLTIAFNADFYLLDSQLPTLPVGQVPGDTQPGTIIRPRAQNTFELF